MAIFSFENGNLVPAQSVDLSVSRLGEETLAALRARALELIDEPLFPIAWTSESGPSGERESLIALDPSGQIVTIDVLARLSGEELISVLGAAGRHTDTSAEVLASLKGVSRADFEREWEAFLDVCPPVSHAGPRLYLIVLAVEDEVRSAIDALAGAAVSVRLASVVGSGSQVFISVDELRPRMTSLSSLLETARSRAQVTAATSVIDDVPADESRGGASESVVVDTVVEETPDVAASVEDMPVSEPIAEEWTQPAVEPESASSPVTVSLYADSPESELVDGDGDDEIVEESSVIGETPSVEENVSGEGEKPETNSILSVFPSRRALRKEREERETEQDVEKPTSDISVYSFSSMAMEQSGEQVDNSNLTLSTFDISSRPPTPAQTSQSDTPTVPAPESAVSVESTVSARSAYSVESAMSAEYADEHAQNRSDEDSRAKAIFASLPHFFNKPTADKRRAEQLLWEQAAPTREGRTQARLFSESTADSHSSDAVAQAAEQDSVG